MTELREQLWVCLCLSLPAVSLEMPAAMTSTCDTERVYMRAVGSEISACCMEYPK